MAIEQALHAALNRLAKWRTIFAGWQLGTRASGDPECEAVRDHREVTMMLRAEVSAMNILLIEKGIYTLAEFQHQLLEEAGRLNRQYELFFPGMRAGEDGMILDAKAAQTMQGWRP